MFGMIERYSGIFFGETGPNPEGIRLAFDVENIPQQARAELVDKITLFVNTAITTRRSR